MRFPSLHAGVFFSAHRDSKTLVICARSIRQANNDAMHQGLKTVRMSPTGSLPTAHTTPHQHQKVANRCRFHPLTLTHSRPVVYYTVMKNVLEMFVLCPAYDRNPGRASRDALILHPVSCICDLVDAFVDSTSSSKLRAEAPPARDTAYPSIQRDEAQ